MEIEMWSELVAAVQRLIPNATFGEDYEGQIVIYTNLWEASDGTLHENGMAQ